MNILFLNTENIKLYDLPWALMEAGHHVDTIDALYTFLGHKKETDDLLIEKLNLNSYDFVITYNFSPAISDICNEKKVKYVSWTFDSPLLTLYMPVVRNECNYIFVFDKAEYQDLSKLGIPHLYHLPMAANVSRISGIDITEEDEKKYTSDISFVGNLYHGNAYNLLEKSLNDNNRQYFEQLFSGLSADILEKNIEKYMDESLVNFFNYVLNEESRNHYLMTDERFYGDRFIARKLSELDRIHMLNRLGESFNVRLYTDNDATMIHGVSVYPSVSYEQDMSKIFYLSKININLTIRSIRTGLPLRIFDIMGSGGFLITNYQEEIEDYFTIDEDLVVYHSFDELVEKCRYYLVHEEERIRIMVNGYRKVCQYHTYKQRVDQIIDTVSG